MTTISQWTSNKFSISKIFEKFKGPITHKITEMYYIVYFHEASNKLYIRIIVSYKKKQNQELELEYNRISRSNIFELLTNFDENSEFEHIPRIIELNNCFDTDTNQTMYYLGYMCIPKIKKTLLEKCYNFLDEINYRNVVIPDILYTVKFQPNKDHIINFVRSK